MEKNSALSKEFGRIKVRGIIGLRFAKEFGKKKLKKNFYVFLFVMKKQKKPTNDLGGFA